MQHFTRLLTQASYNTSMAKYSRRVEKKKNPAAVALAKLGASKGGKARAKKLSAERRQEIARLGGKNRWKNKAM